MNHNLMLVMMTFARHRMSGCGYIDMQKRKDVLTTGQVAQICNVAPRTVTKWFDSGQLKGYRIPGSRDRRIPTSELIRFMKDHHMPTDIIETGRIRILIIDSDYQSAEILADAIREKENCKIKTANNSFDAGIIAQKLLPHIIMINLMACDIDAAQVCANVRSNDDLKETRIIAIANSLGENEIDALQKKGFDAALSDSTDTRQAIRIIHELISILS
jgi:excisionase family DNA binding protein